MDPDCCEHVLSAGVCCDGAKDIINAVETTATEIIAVTKTIAVFLSMGGINLRE
jgi:hypothetical protein